MYKYMYRYLVAKLNILAVTAIGGSHSHQIELPYFTFLCVLAHCELLAGLVNIIIVVNVMNKEHPVVSNFQE